MPDEMTEDQPEGSIRQYSDSYANVGGTSVITTKLRNLNY